MATWPSNLPLPLASGYGVNPADQSIRTDMEVGAARVRRRSTARNDRVTVQWTFTDVQMSAFRAWFDQASGAAGGAAWFSNRLRLGTGGTVDCESRFVGPFKSTDQGGLVWLVSGELEIR